MPAYVIEHVGETWEWQGSQGGPNRSYKLALKGADGVALAGIELAQKPDKPAPAVGQTLNGTIDTTGRFPKFRKDPPQGLPPAGGRSDSKESAEIRMMWAIREALAYARLKHDMGKAGDATPAQVIAIADRFVEHVRAAQP